MHADLGGKVSGYFQITKIDRNGKETVYPEQKNLILDNWFKAFFNQNCTTVENTQAKPYGGLSVSGAALGTGTDPVNPTDHKLTNMVLRGYSGYNYESGSDSDIMFVDHIWHGEIPNITPNTYTEIGLYSWYTNSTSFPKFLLTRAILETPIDIKSGESLRFSYRIRYQLSLLPTFGQFTLRRDGQTEVIKYRQQFYAIGRNYTNIESSDELLYFRYGNRRSNIGFNLQSDKLKINAMGSIPYENYNWQGSGSGFEYPGWTPLSRKIHYTRKFHDSEYRTDYTIKTGVHWGVTPKGNFDFMNLTCGLFQMVIWLEKPIPKTNQETFYMTYSFRLGRL